MKTAIFPTTSNPPTFGTILSLRQVEDVYEKIFVCVEDKSRMISTEKIISMLSIVLSKKNSKFRIISNKTNFETATTFPPTLPKFDDIITDNPKIYSNLIGKGYGNVILIPKPLGWDDTFHRIAYERSMTYEKVMNDIKTSNYPEEYIKENMK